jgi:predicted CXXCH cytochrome family protein
MTQHAVPEVVVGNFDDTELHLRGLKYRLERDGDGFFVTMLDPFWRPGAPGSASDESAPTVRRRVVMTTGMHHMQLYWMESRRGNLLLSFPFAWLHEENRWVPNDATLLKPPDWPKSDIWNRSCIKCHSVAGQPRLDLRQLSATTEAAELGITCEACHGPGADHVAEYQNPVARYAHHLGVRSGTTMVDPRDLDHRRASQVCGQCHAITRYRDPGAALVQGTTFQPGDDLYETRELVQHPDMVEDRARRSRIEKMESDSPGFLASYFWADGMVRVAGREYNGLVETPCFERGTMSCLSCHSLHESDPNDQLSAGMDGDAACAACHEGFSARQHTRHEPASSGSRCLNCHMPHTTYGLLKAIRSHKVDSPRVDTAIHTGRPTACNLCHVDKTLSWAAGHLHNWYGHDVRPLASEDSDVSVVLLLLLKGDAAQRAIAAWHLGWQPAWDASGRNWMAPFLAQLLADPYAAVRLMALRSLRSLPGMEGLPFDYVNPDRDGTSAKDEARRRWNATRSGRPDRSVPEILIDARGEIDEGRLRRLVSKRDDRPIDLRE